MPRVMIDSTSLLLRSAGVKTYTYEWIKALSREPSAGGLLRLFPFLDLPPDYHPTNAFPSVASVHHAPHRHAPVR